MNLGQDNEANLREGAFAIPIDVLMQKLLLHRGLVFASQGSFEQAKSCFVDCVNTGKQYDPRIRLECCKQLRQILAKNQICDMRLEKLAESYRFRNRDFIFLVNQSRSMSGYEEQVKTILNAIMQPDQAAILNSDRLSLIKFESRLRRIFSLVPKDSNYAQLKIQFKKLEFEKEEKVGFLPKALQQMVSEFERNR